MMNPARSGQRALIILLASLLVLLANRPARAQSIGRLTLSAPDASSFPTITLALDARDASGAFISGLQPADVSLQENGGFVPVDTLAETRPGLEIFIAINASPAMAIRGADGRSRYDILSEQMAAWTNQASAEAGDRFGLFTNGGQPATGLESPALWLEAFNAYRADFRNSKPSVESITAALAPPSGQPGAPTHRAVVWITSPPEGSQIAQVNALADTLQASAARLFVWSVSPPAAFESEGNQALTRLAESSGGQLITFSGNEGAPDLNAWFEPLRGLYQLTYTSAVRQAGEQGLSAQLQLPEGSLSSDPVAFQVNVQAPNPMFLSPPAMVRRTSPADSRQPLADLQPLSQTLRALVEFPDGSHRPLAATRLYVDGMLAGENTAPPFDTFHWDLSAYTQSGSHTLQLEAVDSLGLDRRSLEIPVEVRIEIPPANLMTLAARNSQAVTAAAAVLAGGILAVVLYLGSRRGLFRARPRPVPGSQVIPEAVSEPAHPLRVQLRPRYQEAGAQLVWLGVDGEPMTGAPIPVPSQGLIFGREPTQATCLLNDPSVEAMHARLTCTDSGTFLLRDLGSVAGTWVNYAPITRDGVLLEHGDILHIGRVAFRFLLVKDAPIRKPDITPTTETA